MYLSVFEDFEPAERDILSRVLEDIRIVHNLEMRDPAVERIALKLANLWLNDHRDPEFLKGMLASVGFEE